MIHTGLQEVQESFADEFRAVGQQAGRKKSAMSCSVYFFNETTLLVWHTIEPGIAALGPSLTQMSNYSIWTG